MPCLLSSFLAKVEEKFEVKGEIITFEGFLKVYLEGTDDEQDEDNHLLRAHDGAQQTGGSGERRAARCGRDRRDSVTRVRSDPPPRACGGSCPCRNTSNPEPAAMPSGMTPDPHARIRREIREGRWRRRECPD